MICAKNTHPACRTLHSNKSLVCHITFRNMKEESVSGTYTNITLRKLHLIKIMTGFLISPGLWKAQTGICNKVYVIAHLEYPFNSPSLNYMYLFILGILLCFRNIKKSREAILPHKVGKWLLEKIFVICPLLDIWGITMNVTTFQTLTDILQFAFCRLMVHHYISYNTNLNISLMVA